jgi:hypothetical protein
MVPAVPPPTTATSQLSSSRWESGGTEPLAAEPLDHVAAVQVLIQ